MRWETMVWISAVLVVATSALHLTMEHSLKTDQTRRYQPSFETSKKQNNTMVPPKTHDQSRDYIDIKEVDVNESKTGLFRLSSKVTESNEESGEECGEGQATNTPPETEAIDENPSTTVTENDYKSTTTDATVTEDDNGDATSPPETESSCEDTIVETSTGRVCGHLWQENPEIISYIDIKYGTFKNRFEAPIFPEANKDDIHDEKVHNKRCPQLQGDESVGMLDCLTLSIFKPAKAELSGASVLVHIHEGNFINGSADPDKYGPEYLVSQGIILILPNYRLGPLGFLCLQNEEAPGNAALKDLSLALRWIKMNIEKFGGNPENIAVSGEGTAGALVGYLALSPMSKSYINKVITESGSVLSHWALDRNPTDAATKLKNSVTGSLQDVDIDVLMSKAKDIVWRPCLESNSKDNKGTDFMSITPWTMLQNTDINVTFMIGSAKYAGVHESLSHTEDSIKELDANVSLLLPNDLEFETTEKKTKVGNKVKAQYFREAAISLDNVKQRTLYYTDVAYLGPGIRVARSLVDSGATVHFYEFSFVGDLNRELVAIQNQVDGAVRGDIIGYLFHQEGMPAEGTKERDMIEQLVQLWTSFLKTGTPETDDIEWNKFEKVIASQEQWLSIDTDETSLKTGLHVERIGLWTDIYNDHFIDRSLAFGVSSSVYMVLILQAVFFISFFRSAWHFF